MALDFTTENAVEQLAIFNKIHCGLSIESFEEIPRLFELHTVVWRNPPPTYEIVTKIVFTHSEIGQLIFTHDNQRILLVDGMDPINWFKPLVDKIGADFNPFNYYSAATIGTAKEIVYGPDLITALPPLQIPTGPTIEISKWEGDVLSIAKCMKQIRKISSHITFDLRHNSGGFIYMINYILHLLFGSEFLATTFYANDVIRNFTANTDGSLENMNQDHHEISLLNHCAISVNASMQNVAIRSLEFEKINIIVDGATASTSTMFINYLIHLAAIKSGIPPIIKTLNAKTTALRTAPIILMSPGKQSGVEIFGTLSSFDTADCNSRTVKFPNKTMSVATSYESRKGVPTNVAFCPLAALDILAISLMPLYADL